MEIALRHGTRLEINFRENVKAQATRITFILVFVGLLDGSSTNALGLVQTHNGVLETQRNSRNYLISDVDFNNYLILLTNQY